VSRRLSVMNMVAPLFLTVILGCSAQLPGRFPPSGQLLGLTTTPVPPLPVYPAVPATPSRLERLGHPDYDVTGSAVISLKLGPDARRLIALHATLPLPSLIEITNLDNECSIIVRIVGRGAGGFDRVIEISPAVAELLRIRSRGDVQVKYLKTATFGHTDVVEQSHLARFPNLGCTQ
jgi:hypothetical protein